MKAKIKAGDMVRFTGDTTSGTVQSVKGDQAQVFWIGFRLGPGYDGWHPTKNLRLIRRRTQRRKGK
jgi:hypothetical protein